MVGGPREAPVHRNRKRDRFMGFFRKTKAEDVATEAVEVEQSQLPGNFLATAPNVAVLERPNALPEGGNDTMVNRIRLVLKKVEETGAQSAGELNQVVVDPPSRSSSFPGDVGPGNTTTAVSVVSAGIT